MRNVDNADAGFLPFVRQIQDAASIGPLLDSQSFASVAVAIQIVVADQDHVVRFGRGLGAQRQEHESGERKYEEKGFQVSLPNGPLYSEGCLWFPEERRLSSEAFYSLLALRPPKKSRS